MLAAQLEDRRRWTRCAGSAPRRVLRPRRVAAAAAAILGRVRRLNEFFYRLRWGNLEERRRRGLIRLHERFSRTPFADKYWMIMGLLLGCMRDGAPISWDRDSDFGFLDRDLPRSSRRCASSAREGYDLGPRRVNNDGRTTTWTLKYQAVKTILPFRP